MHVYVHVHVRVRRRYHTSWVKVVWDFIFSERVGPHSRSITHECTSKRGLVDGMPSTPEYYEALKKDK